MKALRIWLVWAGCALAACGGVAGVSSNSETHFLGFCSADDCDDGLSCICGVCTVTCDPAASCGALNPDAICTQPSAAACGDDTEPSVCDVDCEDDGDCASVGADYRCQAGFCRPPGCVYEGSVYARGATFDATDGCNTCSCTASGEVVCTTDVCPESCEYEGQNYEIGDGFPSADGCNTCTCTSDGVACTDIGCPASGSCQIGDRIYENGESFPAGDGCNTCTCDDGITACTLIECVSPACLLPFEGGECDAAIPVYYFNPETFQCEERTYGGCGGNDNRFDTLEACQASCPYD